MTMDAARALARAEAEFHWRSYKAIGRRTSVAARRVFEQTSALMDQLAGIKREVHTIPVPNGWSPEQAWEAISRGDELTDPKPLWGDELTDPEPLWANVLVRDGEFAEVLDA